MNEEEINLILNGKIFDRNKLEQLMLREYGVV